MAAAITGGLVTTCVVTLFVLPGPYRRVGDVPETELTDVSFDSLIDLTAHEPMERIGGNT